MITNGVVSNLHYILQDGKRLIIDKVLADYLLENCVFEKQRPIYKEHVGVLCNAMRVGTFKPETLMFRSEYSGIPQLMDGQHRLCAISDTGIPQEFLVDHVVLKSAAEIQAFYASIGRPRIRGVKDVCRALDMPKVAGLTETQCKQLMAAVLHISNRFQNNVSSAKANPLCQDMFTREKTALEWTPEAKLLFDSVRGEASSNGKRLTVAPVMAVLLLCAKHQPAETKRFIYQYLDGGIKYQQARTLAKWLNLKSISSDRGPSASRAVARTWNAFYAGNSLSKIKNVDALEKIPLLGTRPKYILGE